jgi:hypothetical protein
MWEGNSVADPDPGSGAFLPLDPGWVQNQDPDPGEQPGSYFRQLKSNLFWVNNT